MLGASCVGAVGGGWAVGRGGTWFLVLVRQQYTAEHAAHEAYAALAENAGTHRCMLLRMAQEECEHAQLILCILQNCL